MRYPQRQTYNLCHPQRQPSKPVSGIYVALSMYISCCLCQFHLHWAANTNAVFSGIMGLTKMDKMVEHIIKENLMEYLELQNRIGNLGHKLKQNEPALHTEKMSPVYICQNDKPMTSLALSTAH